MEIHLHQVYFAAPETEPTGLLMLSDTGLRLDRLMYKEVCNIFLQGEKQMWNFNMLKSKEIYCI